MCVGDELIEYHRLGTLSPKAETTETNSLDERVRPNECRSRYG